MRGFVVRVGAVVVAGLLAAACGGSSAPPPTPPPHPPSAPGSVSALPRNGSAQLTWPASAGATGYAVYYGTTPQVTTASARVLASGTSATIPGLVNGTPHWFAVAATNGGGEGTLSPVGCAVPTAADQAGLTLYDALCGGSLVGSRWWPDGLHTVEVVGGAAELHAEMDGMEPFAASGSLYGLSQSVNAAGRRVTTLRATITVPRDTAERVGVQAQIRASLRLRYGQGEDRLLFPRGVQDVLAVEVGLVDQGAGLTAFRTVYHCDDASCATSPSTGVAFADPVGWADEAGLRVAPAAYDTPYTFEVRLAEGEGTDGVFHWSVSGGAFGAGVSGSADPAEYLAGEAWSGVPIAGVGSTAFEAAQLRVFTADRSPAGGGSGRITGRFDDVGVGFDDGPAVPFDDFAAAPSELDATRWRRGGAGGVVLSGGSLVLRHRTAAGDFAKGFQGLLLPDPSSIGMLQADVQVASSVVGPAETLYSNFMIQGHYYNDGSPGAAPGSAVGDVFASVYTYTERDAVEYFVGRCLAPACETGLDPIASGTFPGARVGSAWHTVRVAWSPATQRFTFSFDGSTVIVDPTVLAPVVGPANAPTRRIAILADDPSAYQARASIEARVNNVFTAP